MPKENIERAIVRGGGKHGSEVEEVIYEGFAPGGVSVIVEAATDNSQRTTSEIKNIFRNFGASFGQPGSAAYQFGNVGRIIVKKNSKSYDEIFECVAESGAKDLEEINDNVFVYADLSHLSKIRNKLEDLGFQVVSTELIRKPLITLTMENETEREKVINFLHKLEEFDDVQKVYSNLK